MTLLSVTARPLGAALILAGGIAACSPQPTPNPARQAEIAACETGADRVFQKQNRYLLSERGNLDAPESGIDPDSDKSMGTEFLAGQYRRNQQVTACERGSGISPDVGSLPAPADRSEEPATE